MQTDAELLHAFVERRDERAFEAVVRRHLGLVYAAALRRAGGRTHLAEEIAQTVFADLARKASALQRHPALAGWLYRSTRYAAIDAVRAETRRQKLVEKLSAMPDDLFPPDAVNADWQRLRPVIDEAMDGLRQRDRELMLLRYFEGLGWAEIGARLGLSENAARMRTERALETLRAALGRRAVTSTAVALGLALGSPAFAAAPASLAPVVSAAAVAAAPAAGAVAAATSLVFMSKLSLPVITAVVAGGLTIATWPSVARVVNAEELAALRRENVRLTEATRPGADPAALATLADELSAQRTTQAAAVVRAIERKQSRLAAAGQAHAVSARAVSRPDADAAASGHRNRGQATPHDAFMTFAWADDAAEIEAAAKAICFEPKVREKALAVHASMPESLRTQYPTPEELYAFFFVADALVAPPPGADLLENYTAVELAPGRVAMRPPGVTRNIFEFQQTAEGWKWIVPEAGVENAPNVLGNETLAKLGALSP